MVQGIGGIGSGSIKDVPAYKELYSKYLMSKSSVSFVGWLQLSGYDEYFYQQIENYIETGNVQNDDTTVDSISSSKYISKGNNAIYQSQDDETFYEFDWSNGTYSVIHGKEEAAKHLGLEEGTTFDTISFGKNKADITDYTFGNLEDGQDSTTKGLFNSKYGNKVSFVSQEFDLDYIFNALLMDPSDQQYIIASQIFEDLCLNMNQWLPQYAQVELDNIAEQYGTDSAEYKARLKELMLENLDQANEWIEGHEHLSKNSVDAPDFDTRGDGENAEGTVPEYNLDDVLQNSGLATNYYANTTWDSVKHYHEDRKASLDEALAYAEQAMTNYINALISEMGDAATEEIRDYMLKAKNAVLQGNAGENTYGNDFFDEIAGRKHADKAIYVYRGGIGWGHNDYTQGKVDVKKMIDQFNSEFEYLCKSKGKTEEEVAAEKAESEKRAANEKDAYKTLYNMNMKSTAQEAGVQDSYQVVNAYLAAEFQAKAEAEIIEPLKAKIKSKLAGKEITESDLNKILEYASEYALANPSGYASTSNNHVYTIDTSKVVDKFEEAVKKAVKQKGFNF